MIVYCCYDLIFATKIRATAEAVGVGSRPARDVQALENRLRCVDDGRLNEPVSAVLIDLDLGEDALTLIDTIKRYDTMIPVVAFGAHVATQLLQSAHDHGADFVMPRGQFTATLPTILERFGEADI